MILFKSVVYVCDGCLKSTIKFEGTHLSGREIRDILKNTHGWKICNGKHYCNDAICIFKRKWKIV